MNEIKMKTNFLRNKRGTAIVEMAIVLPLLLIILFGIVEFGVMLYDRQVITNASREAARAGIVQAVSRPTSTFVIGVVNDYCDPPPAGTQRRLFNLGGPLNLTTRTYWDNGNVAGYTWVEITGGNPICQNFPDNLRVEVTFPYDFLIFSRLISAFGSTINLTANTIMKCE